VRVERAVSRPAVRPAYDLRRLDDLWLALAGAKPGFGKTSCGTARLRTGADHEQDPDL
jgi:hypothetical protein